MQSQKKNIIKYLAFIVIQFFIVFLVQVAAADIEYPFTSQIATGSGSSNSKISVDSNLKYVNKGDNSSIVGNYFSGVYYDSILGFFKMDWSTNPSENVRIVGSTSLCATGYGYKLGGYARSTTVGFVDFDYNSSIYVYYCLADKSFYGYSYSMNNGFQNFRGLSFEIDREPTTIAQTPSGTGVFINETTTVLAPIVNSNPSQGTAVNSNFTKTTIQNDIIDFNTINESLFYIIK